VNGSDKDIITAGGENTSAFGARCSQVFDAFNPRLRDIAAKGLRGWWLAPPRTGMHRLIAPWEYRHLRFYGVARVAGAGVDAAAGAVCLSYGAYGWAVFFLAIGALNLAGGSWFLTIARSAPARTGASSGTRPGNDPVPLDLPADGRPGRAEPPAAFA
jgi:hypothetical protein